MRTINSAYLFGVSMRLPVLVAALLVSASPAFAAPATADQAAVLLAKAQFIDGKCNILSETDGQELRDLVARAEILLAEQKSVKQARAILAKGRSEGKSAICDEAARKLVREVHQAARSASALPEDDLPPVEGVTEKPADQYVEQQPAQPQKPLPMQQSTVAGLVKPQKQTAEIKVVDERKLEQRQKLKPKLAEVKKKVTVKPQKPVKPVTLTKEAGKNSDLSGYSQLAENYYVQLRCRTMSSREIKRLYANVLATHKQAMATNRAGAVRALLRRAESRAGSRSC
jgi:hypothetical protein